MISLFIGMCFNPVILPYSHTQVRHDKIYSNTQTGNLVIGGDLIGDRDNIRNGFAGPRVIEQTVRETLPEGFQRAEFLLDKGAIDLICDRREMGHKIAKLLAKFNHRPVVDVAS